MISETETVALPRLDVSAAVCATSEGTSPKFCWNVTVNELPFAVQTESKSGETTAAV